MLLRLTALVFVASLYGFSACIHQFLGHSEQRRRYTWGISVTYWVVFVISAIAVIWGAFILLADYRCWGTGLLIVVSALSASSSWLYHYQSDHRGWRPGFSGRTRHLLWFVLDVGSELLLLFMMALFWFWGGAILVFAWYRLGSCLHRLLVHKEQTQNDAGLLWVGVGLSSAVVVALLVWGAVALA